MKILKKTLPFILVIFWMSLIFYFSHQPVYKSNGLSKKVTQIVIDTVEKASSKKNINISRMNHIIRKNAHFFAYLILGVLVSNLLKNSRGSISKRLLLALAICVLYAISDEFHQLFVPGRGGQVRDVLIDSAGATVGILISSGFLYISNSRKDDYLYNRRANIE